MRVLVYLPFLLSALAGLTGPWLADRLPPRAGTRLLLATGVACATTALLSLFLLTWALIGRLPLVAAVGAWSGDLFHHDEPVAPLTAEIAGVVLAALTCTAGWTAVRRVRALNHARRSARRFGEHRLVVVDRTDAEAFAVPAGRRDQGRIVVSTGMLRTLTTPERRVLLAHETAHLRHGHHRHRALATMIAAANPLLATMPAAVDRLTERWADEEAATTTGDRTLAARALARAALAARPGRSRTPADGAVLCFGDGGVGHRVRALLGGTPRHRPVTSAALLALLAACLFSAADAGQDSAQLLDHARDHYTARPLGVTTAARDELHHLLVVTGDLVIG